MPLACCPDPWVGPPLGAREEAPETGRRAPRPPWTEFTHSHASAGPASDELTLAKLQRNFGLGEDRLAQEGQKNRIGRLASMGHLITEKQWQAGPLSEAAQPTGASRELLVIVVEDTPVLSRTIGFLCDYLGIRVETVPSHASLEELLPAKRPMAVMSPIDTPAQDGCHVLKTVADYDRSLPVLLVTGTDPALLGAVEAVEEIWKLDQVQKMTCTPGIGDLVEFLFKAGRRSGSSLMPT